MFKYFSWLSVGRFYVGVSYQILVLNLSVFPFLVRQQSAVNLNIQHELMTKAGVEVKKGVPNFVSHESPHQLSPHLNFHFSHGVIGNRKFCIIK